MTEVDVGEDVGTTVGGTLSGETSSNALGSTPSHKDGSCCDTLFAIAIDAPSSNITSPS
jgi:hypothetical protein